MDLSAFLGALGPFGAGLLSAASPCLLPLYPGFIAYLGSNARSLEGRTATGLLGTLVLLGVLTTMTIVGVILAIVAVPTSRLLAYATPVVDGLLIVLGLLCWPVATPSSGPLGCACRSCLARIGSLMSTV